MQEQNLPKPITPEGGNAPNVESVPPIGGVEQAPSVSPEATPARGDGVNQSGPMPQLAPIDLPQPITQQITDPVQDIANDTSLPAVADDVDVIEKVWVEKAKTIVKQTKDDPYTQEKQVSSLQEDYQKKRYGKDPVNG